MSDLFTRRHNHAADILDLIACDNLIDALPRVLSEVYEPLGTRLLCFLYTKLAFAYDMTCNSPETLSIESYCWVIRRGSRRLGRFQIEDCGAWMLVLRTLKEKGISSAEPKCLHQLELGQYPCAVLTSCLYAAQSFAEPSSNDLFYGVAMLRAWSHTFLLSSQGDFDYGTVAQLKDLALRLLLNTLHLRGKELDSCTCSRRIYLYLHVQLSSLKHQRIDQRAISGSL